MGTIVEDYVKNNHLIKKAIKLSDICSCNEHFFSCWLSVRKAFIYMYKTKEQCNNALGNHMFLQESEINIHSDTN